MGADRRLYGYLIYTSYMVTRVTWLHELHGYMVTWLHGYMGFHYSALFGPSGLDLGPSTYREEVQLLRGVAL
jgi:hypothetical protein